MRTLISPIWKPFLATAISVGLAACGNAEKAVAHAQADARLDQTSEEAAVLATTLPPEAAAPFKVAEAFPEDLPEAAHRLAAFDAAVDRGDTWIGTAVPYTTFDPEERELERYPKLLDLACEIEGQGQAATSWCAHGRMGEADEKEVAQHVPYLLNGDVVALEGRISCTSHLCLYGDGTVAGALQPPMRAWMTEHCVFHVDAMFECK